MGHQNSWAAIRGLWWCNILIPHIEPQHGVGVRMKTNADVPALKEMSDKPTMRVSVSLHSSV